MRRILVDHARTKGRQKRGGTRKRVDLGDPVAVLNDPDDLLDLDDALQRLKAEDPRCAEMVSLRMFAGLTMDDVAKVMDVSRATAFREWTYALAWLQDDLGKCGERRGISAT